MKEIVIMKFILSVLILLASVLASVGAVNYPARTNGNNTFYGTNTLIRPLVIYDTITDGNGFSNARLGIGCGLYSANGINVFVGYNAGLLATNAANNVMIGNTTGRYANNALYGVFIGQGAGNGATNSTVSIAIGRDAMNAGHSVDSAIFMGYRSGRFSTNSDYTIAIGEQAGQSAYSAQNSIYIGRNAGSSMNLSNKLSIHSSSSDVGTNGLIYGEFDNRLLRVNGNLDVTNTIFGMRPFGSLMLIGDENLNLAVSGTYYQVVNYDVLSTNYFASSLANGTLTNLVAGYYKIDITCSFDGSGGVNDLFESSVFTNTTECATISFHRKTGSADTGSAASSGIVYLPANCRIDARFQNTSSTGTIVLRHYNLTVTMQ